jgi:hypothetical protein
MPDMPSIAEAAMVWMERAAPSSNHVARGSAGLASRRHPDLAPARSLLEPCRCPTHRGRDDDPLDHFGALPTSEVPVDLLLHRISVSVVPPRMSRLVLCDTAIDQARGG